MRHVIRVSAVLLAWAAAAGCAPTAPADSEPVTDGDSLLEYLADQGYLLVPDGLARPTLAAAASGRYRLEGASTERAEVTVYEFETDAEAAQGLQTLQTEVRPRTDRDLFAGGRLVVLYQSGVRSQSSGGGLRRSLARVLGRADLL